MKIDCFANFLGLTRPARCVKSLLCGRWLFKLPSTSFLIQLSKLTTSTSSQNHDVARSVNRFGDVSTPDLRSLSAKCLAAMQCTLSGTLYVYQGEEIGQANLPRSWGLGEYKDIASEQFYAEELHARQQQHGTDKPDMSDVWDSLQHKARDHARSPMQWDASKHAGFSNANDAWMRVNEDYLKWNVARQQGQSDSVLEFWKSMIQFRKKYLACVSSRRFNSSLSLR